MCPTFFRMRPTSRYATERFSTIATSTIQDSRVERRDQSRSTLEEAASSNGARWTGPVGRCRGIFGSIVHQPVIRQACRRELTMTIGVISDTRSTLVDADRPGRAVASAHPHWLVQQQ